MWRTSCCPSSRPPCPCHQYSPREGKEPIQLGIGVVAGAARKVLWTTPNCLRVSNSGSSVRVYSLSLSLKSDATRQQRFGIGVFLLLGGLPTKADEPHLPGASYPPFTMLVKSSLTTRRPGWACCQMLCIASAVYRHFTGSESLSSLPPLA